MAGCPIPAVRRSAPTPRASLLSSGVEHPCGASLVVCRDECEAPPRLQGPTIRASTITSCARTDRVEGRCDLGHRAVAWPGEAVISSLTAHGLLQIVRSSTLVERHSRGRSSENARPRSRAARAAPPDRLAKRAYRRRRGAYCSDSSGLFREAAPFAASERSVERWSLPRSGDGRCGVGS